MAEALAHRTDIQAIHIVGHGEAGALSLGSALLRVDNLDAYAGELGAIGRALAPGGDIQLWGCQVGAGAEGQAFIQALAEVTGADIAASDDLTGSAGDWVLETQTGPIEASVAMTPAGQQAFAGTLAIGRENFGALPTTVLTGTTLTAGDWTFTSNSPSDMAVVPNTYAVWLNSDEGAGDRAVLLNFGGSPSVTGFTMGSTDGSNFTLQSFKIGQQAGTNHTMTIAAYSNGVQVVAPETVNLTTSDSTGSIHYNLTGNDSNGPYGALTFDGSYSNIDELRFAVGSISDLHIDQIVATPVVEDVTAPLFASAAVNGATLVMTYTEASTLDAVNGPSAGSFAVTAGGASVTVTAVAVSDAAKTVTLTLQNAVTAGQAVTVAYTDPSGGNDANAIQDAAGNDAASLTATSVTNNTPDTTAPAVSGNIVVPSDGAYIAGQILSFTVGFDENVTVTGADSTLGLTIGSTARSASYASKTADSITYSYTVQAGDSDSDGIAVGSISLGSSTIRDSAGNNADLSLSGHLPSTSGVLVDAVAPAVSGNIAAPSDGAYTAGQTLSFVVGFDENVTVTGADSTLGLTIGSTARSASYASKTADSITYSYTVQAGDSDSDGIAVGSISLGSSTIRDSAGHNANLSLSGHLPSTSGVLVDAVAPVFASASVTGATLVMTYSDVSHLDAFNLPSIGAFAVLAGGSPVSVTAVTLDGAARTVTLTLASPVAAGGVVTVAYTDPTAGNDAQAIQDATGTDAESLTAVTVTNNTPAPAPEPEAPSPAPPQTQVIDGVPVQRTSGTTPDGTPTQTLTIPIVQGGRVETVGGNNVADIPLIRDSAGASLLTVQLPVGLGLSASGPTQPRPAADSLSDLIREIKARTSDGAQDQDQLTSGGTGFLSGLATSTPIVAQTIVPTGSSPGAPLGISGQPQSPGQAQTVLVIDTRGNSGVHIELNNVDFAAVIGAARVTGGEGSQHVWGDGASQNIFLGADDDALHGGGGADTVGSAGGNDQIFGGEGDDQVFGDMGDDILQGNAGHDTLNGGHGADRMHGGQDNDVLFGNEDADLLFGDLGDDVLQGNAGADTLQGGAGNDRLHGGRDNDVLFGGEGDDLLIGDAGDDEMTGGAGADLFTTWGGGMDRVLDFSVAEGDRVGYATGTAYSIAQVGADTVITLSAGGQTTLVNVQMSSLSEGWIIAI